MEHLAEICPVVQILDVVPVQPLLIEQYAEIWNLEEDILGAAHLLDRDFQVPVILDVIPLRTLVPEPKIAEHLAEVHPETETRINAPSRDPVHLVENLTKCGKVRELRRLTCVHVYSIEKRTILPKASLYY